MAVADYSGQAWLQGFNEVGIAVFGMTANQLLEIKVGHVASKDCPFLIEIYSRTVISQSTTRSCTELIATLSTSLVVPNRIPIM